MRYPFYTVRSYSVRCLAATACALIALAPLTGCHQNDPGADPKLEKLASDANSIASRSGGDWNKLTPDEKTMMLNLQHGNEAAAKDLLFALSGKTHEGQFGTPGHFKGQVPGGTPPTGQ